MSCSRAMVKMNGKWDPFSRSERGEPEEVLDTGTGRGTRLRVEIPKGFEMDFRMSLVMGLCQGEEQGLRQGKGVQVGARNGESSERGLI